MNVDRYEKDLDALIKKGEQLYNAMGHECNPQEFARSAKEQLGDRAEQVIQGLPSFKDEYQAWYSEARVLVRQLLPDRLADFTGYYERPRTRRQLTSENYRIEDYLQGFHRRAMGETIVGPDAAIPCFQQQLGIVKSVRERFQSSLFDIRQLAQADLFDSELAAAKELAGNGFNRAAGVLAGVVLERHLKEVCSNHGLTVRSRHPQIVHLNEALKEAEVIDIPQWRSIQYLGDLRNLCAHDGDSEPTAGQVADILEGVSKVTKTLF